MTGVNIFDTTRYSRPPEIIDEITLNAWSRACMLYNSFGGFFRLSRR